MDLKIEGLKVTASAMLTYFIAKLEQDIAARMLMLFLLLVFLDTISGWAKAKKKGEWQSSRAKWGMMGKLLELGFIAIAYEIDWVFRIDTIKQAFIVYFCLVEIGSIIENAYELGVPIPKEVVNMGTKSKYFFGWFLIKRLENILTAAFKMDYKEIEKIAEEKEKEEKEKVSEK